MFIVKRTVALDAAKNIWCAMSIIGQVVELRKGPLYMGIVRSAFVSHRHVYWAKYYLPNGVLATLLPRLESLHRSEFSRWFVL